MKIIIIIIIMIIIIIIISVDKNNKFKKITATKILKQNTVKIRRIKTLFSGNSYSAAFKTELAAIFVYHVAAKLWI